MQYLSESRTWASSFVGAQLNPDSEASCMSTDQISQSKTHMLQTAANRDETRGSDSLRFDVKARAEMWQRVSSGSLSALFKPFTPLPPPSLLSAQTLPTQT